MKKNIDQIIEDSLRIEPNFKLGLDFKDRVTKLIRKREQRSQRKLYLLISMGVVLMFGTGFGILSYYGSLLEFSKFNRMVPLAVVFGTLVVVVQYLDKKLVKDKFFKQLV